MDLESMIGSDNASSLYNDTSIYKDSATMYKFYGYMRLVLSFVSFLSDVLIVTVMAKNRSANTRTNKLLMHFGIMDAFCMLNEMGVFYMVLDTVMTHLRLNRLFCVFVIFEVTSLCASFLFIFLLLSNTLMKSTRFSDRTLLSVYYAIIGGILTSEILLCAIRPSSFSIFHSINFVLFAIAAVCLLIKEVNRMYKYFKNRPLSQSTAFRMNVARIYVYSCWTNFFFYGPNKFFLVISLSGYLAGFYILLYLAYSDRNFKSCLMDFLKFRMHNRDADGTVRFADDCSEDGRPDYNVTMDQLTEDVLDNSTHHAYESDLKFEIHSYLQTFACVLSMVSDLLVVAVVLKSTRMRTRTNNVIVHFAVADAFCMLNEMGLIYYIYEQVVYKMLPTHSYCLFAIYEVTSQFACLLFLNFLLSNYLIKTQRFTDRALLIGYYSLIGVTFLVDTLFCALHLTYLPVFHMGLVFVFMITLACLVVKEINRGYKMYKKRPLSEKTAFRMNVARIYMYSWLITTLTFYYNEVFFLYLSLIGYFSGFSIALYLVYSDRNFKISLLNLFRFGTRSYDVDATISFADDCSRSSMDDGQPDVNITFNGNVNSRPET